MPSSFPFVPLDRVNTADLLAFVFHGPIKVILGLEVFLDDIKIGVGLIDAECRRKISSLQITQEIDKSPEFQ